MKFLVEKIIWDGEKLHIFWGWRLGNKAAAHFCGHRDSEAVRIVSYAGKSFDCRNIFYKFIDIYFRQLYYTSKAIDLNGGGFMEKMKKLPDAEFDVMKTVWANESPITTTIIMEQLGKEKGWKIQTVVSLMLRLVQRGFLRSEKHGKERTYFPLVSKEDYLKFETGNFIKQYHNNSLFNLINTLYDDKPLSDTDIDELLKWVKERGG